MKMRSLSVLSMLCFAMCYASQSFGSGCFNESFYNMETVAKEAGAKSCYYEKLAAIPNPVSMADRQYNYFAGKLNEYVTVLGLEPFDKAQFEFMFYPGILKGLLAKEDARKVDFEFTQTFNCYRADRVETKVSYQIHVYGVVGLTGVCLYKDKQAW